MMMVGLRDRLAARVIVQHRKLADRPQRVESCSQLRVPEVDECGSNGVPFS